MYRSADVQQPEVDISQSLVIAFADVSQNKPVQSVLKTLTYLTALTHLRA